MANLVPAIMLSLLSSHVPLFCRDRPDHGASTDQCHHLLTSIPGQPLVIALDDCPSLLCNALTCDLTKLLHPLGRVSHAVVFPVLCFPPWEACIQQILSQ
jgi:hypothetical protein